MTTCDTRSYIARVNATKLCGKSNWRLPTSEELIGLVDTSASSAPFIFAELGSTAADPVEDLTRGYWSSTVSPDNPATHRLAVSFSSKTDNTQDHPMGNLINNYIRLVHD